uniref:transposase n=1 Tax=Actinomadura sp. CA-154981 TaxID=3240037 RepID=UPI003F49163C
MLAGTELGQSKSQDGAVEIIRTLRVARRSAMKARTQAANQLRAVLVTAPDQLREQLRGLSLARLVATATRFRPGEPDTLEAAGKLALKCLATRYRQLDEEIKALDTQINRLAHQAAPALMSIKGIGPDTAAALLIAAGDKPDRLHSEAAFAHMCGAAPIPASSGNTLAICRLSYDPRAQAYATRRTSEGKTKREIIRCLKRYLAREVYKAITSDNTTTRGTPPAITDLAA